MDQHLPSSTNIYLPYQFELPHMYCFESRLEVSDAETPHVLGSEDGFQYIQHEVPNKSRRQIKLIIIYTPMKYQVSFHVYGGLGVP